VETNTSIAHHRKQVKNDSPNGESGNRRYVPDREPGPRGNDADRAVGGDVRHVFARSHGRLGDLDAGEQVGLNLDRPDDFSVVYTIDTEAQNR
jgi:hypothetical protein